MTNGGAKPSPANLWVAHPDYPGLRRLWSAHSLRQAMQCWRRYYYGTVRCLAPRPRPGETRPPHTEFGSKWHECVELYDRERLEGLGHQIATEHAIRSALALTWDPATDTPWAGQVMSLWTCTGVETTTTKVGKQRRRFLCDAARGEWATPLVNRTTCPKCDRPVEMREAYVPHHPTKNRLGLLRAVLAYCDDQADSGLRPTMLEDGTPALEIEFELDLPRVSPDGRPYVIRGKLDRVTEFKGGGGTGIFPHERKTTTRALGKAYRGNFSPDPQVDTYDWVADRLYLNHEGVIIEALQVLQGGARLLRWIETRGPEHRAEWEREMLATIAEAEERAYAAASQNDLWPGTCWPRNTSACTTAAGGQPCEFRDICAAAPSTRERMIQHGFVEREEE